MATHISTDRRMRRKRRRAGATSAPLLTVTSTSDRLLGESLDELMEQLACTDGRLPATSIARLARLLSAVSALRDAHDVDADGRCLRCRGDGWSWPYSRRRPCSVYQVLDEFGHEPSPLPTVSSPHVWLTDAVPAANDALAKRRPRPRSGIA
jgi:hypothetical protein